MSTAVASLLTAGYMYNKDGDWAIARAEELGYFFTERGVLQLFEDVLIVRSTIANTEESTASTSTSGSPSNGTGSTSRAPFSHWLLLVVCAIIVSWRKDEQFSR